MFGVAMRIRLMHKVKATQATSDALLDARQTCEVFWLLVLVLASAAARLELTSRATYTYGEFTRFDVSSEEGRKELINKGKKEGN
jgi:hypothetical protein